MATGGLHIRAPEQLDFTRAHEAWPEWKKKFLRYRTVAELDTKSKERQISTLIYVMGDEAEAIFEQLQYSEGKSANEFDDVLEAFEKHFMPRSNYLHHRVQFHNRNQQSGESVDSYIKELHVLASKCEFDNKDNMIRDRLLSGMIDKQLSIELQMSDNTSLAYIVEKMKAKAIIVDNIKKEQQIAAVGFTNATKNRHQQHNHKKSYAKQQGAPQKPQTGLITNCKFCKSDHPMKKCPAYGKTCRKCNRKNHFAKACLSKTVNDIQAKPDDSVSEFFMGAIDFSSVEDNWNVDVFANDVMMTCKVDTGAQCNVMPLSIVKSNFPELPIEKTDVKLTAYTGTKIDIVGQLYLDIAFNSRTIKAVFYVTPSNYAIPILGLQLVRKLGLVPGSIDAISISSYDDVFNGLGKLEGEYQIKLKPDVKPVVCVPRRVPESIKPKLKIELERLENEGVITKCMEPSEWVNHTVNVVRPNKNIRICLDPQYLNQAILREHFQLPRASDIFSRLSKAKVFSTLDATSGFHQIALDTESSKLTTFITPFGRYRYLRLPFGLSCSPEVYHQRVSQMFDDIEGVETYIDDLLIWGSTQEEHDVRLKQVLDRCRNQNFKLNKSKCNFSQPKVEFLGHVISQAGLEPKHDKVHAINNMLTPTCKADVQRFLGMVNYLAKFCPNIAKHTEPLRAVCKSNAEFLWEKPQQEAFEEIKRIITHTPVLKLFDPALEITLSVDASSHSLGAVLLQEQTPVEYAAKSLTDTQQRYAQIEKELLAVLFACQRFHHFVYGRKITVETDHKPLLGLVRKPIGDATPRLQRILLHLQPYEFELVYKPGKELFVADTLSRSCPKQSGNLDMQNDPLEYICNMIIRSDKVLEQFKQSADSDQEMQTLLQYVVVSWPISLNGCQPTAKHYWNIRHDISQVNGLLFYKDRLIVPADKRHQVMLKLHEGHLGLTKTMQKAKQSLYWPRMSNDIQNMINSCTACNDYARKPTTEPLIPTPVPDYPFQLIGTDLFHCEGKDYLLTVDYYSKWITIDLLANTRSCDVIAKLEKIFADFGVPEKIRSDNGPQYNSSEFQSFMLRNGIEHVTSSPAYPRSNGQAERMVQTTKNLIKKCSVENRSYYPGLRALRNTPISERLPSPAKLLQGRILYEGLPSSEKDLFPSSYNKSQVKSIMQENVDKMKKDHDAHVKADHKPLNVGDKIRVKIGSNWEYAKVKEILAQPRSYLVETPAGNTYRRNRRDIRPSGEPDHMFEPDIRVCIGGSNQMAPLNEPVVSPGGHDEVARQSYHVTRSGRVSKPPNRLTY